MESGACCLKSCMIPPYIVCNSLNTEQNTKCPSRPAASGSVEVLGLVDVQSQFLLFYRGGVAASCQRERGSLAGSLASVSRWDGISADLECTLRRAQFKCESVAARHFLPPPAPSPLHFLSLSSCALNLFSKETCMTCTASWTGAASLAVASCLPTLGLVKRKK